MTRTKGLVVSALKETLAHPDFPDTRFKGISPSIEFPIRKESVPAVWVDFTPRGPLSTVGIGHREIIPETDGFLDAVRWRFAGAISFTLVAMSSLERDDLFDLITSMIALGEIDSVQGAFRGKIEQNDLIAVDINWDQIQIGGSSASPGTPWGTDEVIYETTISLDLVGEYVSGVSNGLVLMLPLSSIDLYNWIEDYEDDPAPGPGWIVGG